MKTIGFIGAYDKIDYILYIAKILTTLRKKVLVIDATTKQKARYVVPVINPTVSYVTEFEEIDIAVGFKSLEEIKMYLGIPHEKQLDYEYILIDVDNTEGIQTFKLNEAEKNYFVTSFDIYSLKKGIEVFVTLKEPITLTKILFSKEMTKEEDDYLNYISLGYKVKWTEDRIYFPIENGDLSIIYENQRVAKIKLKRLSTQCTDSLLYITEQIMGNVNMSELRRAIKIIERSI